ncbi:U4/U6.U5 small nuclear ribonucleoprotein [Haplosporangium sp. Z 767]|nr:U4/U6.U5 small nuclear ribonucleoprotein [Haplosporangium sp. Z 767]
MSNFFAGVAQIFISDLYTIYHFHLTLSSPQTPICPHQFAGISQQNNYAPQERRLIRPHSHQSEMPYSPSPERHNDRRGPPKDWDAPEEEEGEISYTGHRGGGASGYRDSRSSGGGRHRDRERSRDRRDYRDRGSDRRRDDRYRDSQGGGSAGRRDYRDRDRSDRDRDRDGRRRRGSRSRSRSRSPYRRGGRSRSRSPRGSGRGHRDDMDVEGGEYRRRRGDSDSEDDKDKDRNKGSDKKRPNGGHVAVDLEKPLEELSPEDEEARMMALMGFGGFDSTKGKKVAGADVSGADIKKQRQYRQYMNRRGGFNRPLDAK